jgi:hypothetical protein
VNSRTELIHCNFCPAMVRVDRMERHISRVHTGVPRVPSRHFMVAGGSGGLGSIDSGEHKKVYTGGPDRIAMESGLKRCRSCGKPAIPGTDLCYGCE